MRIWAAVLCLVAGCGSCKDTTPEKKKAEPAAKQESSGPRPTLEPVQLSGPGVVPVGKLGPQIVVSKDAVSLDGVSMVAVTADAPLDRARLDALTSQLETKATSDAPVAVTLDATIPYRQVALLFQALESGGFHQLALLTGSGSTMIPIELMGNVEANNTAGLRPVVTVRKNYVSLWSASGEEGTKSKPKLAYEVSGTSDFSQITRALADIVRTRWPDGRRADADKTIILQVDGDKPAQVLLQLAAAVRADGTFELFPGIYLAGG